MAVGIAEVVARSGMHAVVRARSADSASSALKQLEKGLARSPLPQYFSLICSAFSESTSALSRVSSPCLRWMEPTSRWSSVRQLFYPFLRIRISSELRLTAAYGALANGGVYIAPRLF
ncbi:MAG: hypothetical protein EBZ46_08270, partial [Actinobacteria bacterium]|nr:hypothetical protein [Actinomycetota bacterium]